MADVLDSRRRKEKKKSKKKRKKYGVFVIFRIVSDDECVLRVASLPRA